MDIVFRPEDETTTVMMIGPGRVFSLVSAQTERLLMTTLCDQRAAQAVDIETGKHVSIGLTDRVILRPGVWCEACADCPKAKEVM